LPSVPTAAGAVPFASTSTAGSACFASPCADFAGVLLAALVVDLAAVFADFAVFFAGGFLAAFLALAFTVVREPDVAAEACAAWEETSSELVRDVLEDKKYLSCRLRGAARPGHVKSRSPIVTRA
jgi:hypothetical protein